MKKTVDQLTPEDWDKIKQLADVHMREYRNARVILIVPKTTIDAQELAMIQSLYSRDPDSILCHLLEVADKGAEKFMAQFYVGYGHKSIGDCGNILLAFEGVSMLAAKAIQDSQLYNGQEASTRYMDFSKNDFLVPIGHKLDGRQKDIQENWREFYHRNSPIVFEHLKQLYPYVNYPDEKESVWEKTLKARTFDIMRGFLPAGAATFLSWWTSLSHASDHLSWLRCHVLQEVRELADVTEGLLKEVYPSSFTRNIYPEREEYKKKWYSEYYLEDLISLDSEEFVSLSLPGKYKLLKEHRKFFISRPKGQDVPWQIGEECTITWSDLLDFGSFRDLQRHRALIQRQGLLTEKFGMHEWYLNNLPEQIADEALELVAHQVYEINKLDLTKFDKQYLFPMGMKIPTRVSGSLSKFMYLIELRAQSTVHPTLHENALELARYVQFELSKIFGCSHSEVSFYINENVGELNLKRGTQDIVKKE
jgi:thymidylate synthase ThyX